MTNVKSGGNDKCEKIGECQAYFTAVRAKFLFAGLKIPFPPEFTPAESGGGNDKEKPLIHQPF
jgi:hypothetical protein